MSHEPGGPKSNRQEPGGSTSECLTIVPKDTYPKSNPQEPVGSPSDCLKFILKETWPNPNPQ